MMTSAIIFSLGFVSGLLKGTILCTKFTTDEATHQTHFKKRKSKMFDYKVQIRSLISVIFLSKFQISLTFALSPSSRTFVDYFAIIKLNI